MKPKIAVFTGSDLTYYGGGEKDVIAWTSRLQNDFDIIIYVLKGKGLQRKSLADIMKMLGDVKVVYYRGRKIRLLKDILPLQRFDLKQYDKVYSMSEGFILNRILQKGSKKFLLGIHSTNVFMKEPLQSKMWKKVFFSIIRPIHMHYLRIADEIRIQNKSDLKNVLDLNYKGKIWNVPPAMLDSTPEPVYSDFYVVWMNRVEPGKRPEDLVKIADMMPDVTFYAIGSGSMTHLFEGHSNIVAKGFVPDNDLPDIMSNASCYISTSGGENFGMSLVEAELYGIPTISYDVMGLRDYADHVVKSMDEMIQWIGNIKRIHENKDSFMAYRNAIRGRAMKHYSNIAVMPQIKEMIGGS